MLTINETLETEKEIISNLKTKNETTNEQLILLLETEKNRYSEANQILNIKVDFLTTQLSECKKDIANYKDQYSEATKSLNALLEDKNRLRIENQLLKFKAENLEKHLFSCNYNIQ